MVRHFGIDSDGFIRKERREKLAELARESFGGDKVIPLEPVSLSPSVRLSSQFGILDGEGQTAIYVLTDVYTLVVVNRQYYQGANDLAKNIQLATGRETQVTENYNGVNPDI